MNNTDITLKIFKHIFCLYLFILKTRASQVALMVKNQPANAGDIRNVSSTPGSGRSPGGGNDNPLAWTEEPGGLQSLGSQKNWTWLKQHSTQQAHIFKTTVWCWQSGCSWVWGAQLGPSLQWAMGASASQSILIGLMWIRVKWDNVPAI